MQKAMIRTTVKMPVWLHKKLKMKAARQNETISQVILENRIDDFRLKTDKIDWEFFDRIAKNGPQFDVAKVIKKQRSLRMQKYE